VLVRFQPPDTQILPSAAASGPVAYPMRPRPREHHAAAPLLTVASPGLTPRAVTARFGPVVPGPEIVEPLPRKFVADLAALVQLPEYLAPVIPHP